MDRTRSPNRRTMSRRLEAALKKTTERLDELTKQQKLTNTELTEFNGDWLRSSKSGFK